ncbi:hypothetical protein HUG15_06895 [Salicibibacter cibarius]|uniref:GNAT family N-acetyltransferase n=1 Tax=Salicibibacter cibarius TaxID=2743000 RepID=A0A7T6Z284_9BACI|nr:hypothetical protein [Salicibibacter cibarius]QQK75342.1 hypothetical protein HUG15_06895 [Salicibibacter cibarius]
MNVHTKDGKETYVGKVSPVTYIEVSKNADYWLFYLRKEYVHTKREVDKLTIIGSDAIQALISYEYRENFLLIHYLESSPFNIGDQSELMITPSILSTICMKSFHQGFDGFVAIHIKHVNTLIRHYRRFGAKMISKNRIYFDDVASNKLIDVYLRKGER